MLPTYARDIRQEFILFEVSHAPSFDLFMVFFNCSVEFSNAVDHKLITERNLMNPYPGNVSGTRCGNLVNDCCSFKGDSGWFLNKLLKTEQVIDICHMFSIILFICLALYC